MFKNENPSEKNGGFLQCRSYRADNLQRVRAKHLEYENGKKSNTESQDNFLRDVHYAATPKDALYCLRGNLSAVKNSQRQDI